MPCYYSNAFESGKGGIQEHRLVPQPARRTPGRSRGVGRGIAVDHLLKGFDPLVVGDLWMVIPEQHDLAVTLGYSSAKGEPIRKDFSAR